MERSVLTYLCMMCIVLIVAVLAAIDIVEPIFFETVLDSILPLLA